MELDPAVVPASNFALRRRVRTERDFDYYLEDGRSRHRTCRFYIGGCVTA